MSTPNTAIRSLDTLRGTVTLNAAFLEEIKEVNLELWRLLDKLRHTCARPISMRSQSHELVDSLAKLRDLIGLQFSLEDAYGYFENPIAVDPRLSRRADALRDDHSKLYLAISRISDLADEMFREGRLASLTTIIPVSFDQFYERLLAHERAERELMNEDLLKEIGIGD